MTAISEAIERVAPGTVVEFPTAGRAVGLGPTPELVSLDGQIRLIDSQIKSLQAQRSSLLKRFRCGLRFFVTAGGTAPRSRC
jgi:hypothetical protein